MQTPASQIDFNEIDNFSESEWPKGVLPRMDAEVIVLINELRSIDPRYSMIPSPLYAAHVRDRTNSQHGTDWGDGPNSRLSTATDFYMSWETALDFWEHAQANPHLGGFGFYLDTMYNGESRPLFHIDTREERILWVRYCRRNTFYVPGQEKDSEYVYHSNNPELFHELMAKAATKR